MKQLAPYKSWMQILPQQGVVPILGSRGSGKCLCKGSKIFDPSTGILRPVEGAFITASLNIDTSKFAPSTSRQVDSGLLNGYEVKVSTGASVIVTAEHPFLAYNKKWVLCKDLQPDETLVAVPAYLKYVPSYSIGTSMARLAGYLIGDGSIGENHSTPTLTAADSEVVEDVQKIAESLGLECTIRPYKKNPNVFNISIHKEFHRIDSVPQFKNNKERMRYAVRMYQEGYVASDIAAKTGIKHISNLYHSLRMRGIPARHPDLDHPERTVIQDFIAKHGMQEKAHGKRIPPVFFGCPKEELKALIEGLWATDGSIERFSAVYYSTSQELCDDIRHLLLRFGIVAVLRDKTIKYKGLDYKSFSVAVRSDYIGDFARTFSVPGIKGQKLKKFIDYHGSQKYWPSSVQSIREGDVEWVKVVSVTPVGKQHFYDLCDTEHQNFVAQDIVLHNSALSWWIADGLHAKGRKVAAWDIPQAARHFFPHWVTHVSGNIQGLRRFRNYVIIVDEVAIRAPARRSQTDDNLAWIQLVAIARQAHQLLIFISQNNRQLDVLIVSEAEIICWKMPSVLHVRFSRAEFKEDVQKARELIMTKKRPQEYTYIMNYVNGREGFLRNGIPSWWTEQASEAYSLAESGELEIPKVRLMPVLRPPITLLPEGTAQALRDDRTGTDNEE